MKISIFVFMKIEKHIEQLLYRHQCVTIPNFGAFLTNVLPAEVNAFTQTFSPPHKTVSFNTHIKNNDGLLINHIITIEKIDYETALKIIETAVESWTKILQSTNTLSFKNIGTIKKNEFDTQIFESSYETNYLATSFGLHSFVSPSVKREFENSNEKIIKLIPQAKEVRVETPVQYIQKTNYFNYAAVAVIAIGTFGYVGNKFYNQQIEAQNQITQSEVRKEVNQKIQEATFFITNPLQYSDVNVAEAEKHFHIVAGSFRSKRNLKNLMKRMTLLGYNPKALPQDSLGITQVLFGSYATFGAAQTALDKIHISENPEAWILIKKL